MSAEPDSADLAPSRDPAAYGRRPLFSAGLVAWLAACVVCLALGAGIGRFWNPWPPAKPEAAPPASEPRTTPAQTVTPPALASVTAPPPAAPASRDQAALAARVARLESTSSRTNEAAAEALAASALAEAAEGSAPFDQDLATFGRLAPGDPDLRALAPLAAMGAPSRAALAAAFPDLASAAAAGARQPPRDADFLSKLLARLGEVVIIRRVGPGAQGVDATLYRAQSEVGAGDLEDALSTLARLPPSAAAPLASWTDAARRRVEIDQRIRQVRARALAALAEGAQGPA